MTAKAIAKHIRISPYKVRRIAQEVQNKRVVDVESYLDVLTNKGALAIKRVVHSARTNYLNKNTGADEENLIITKINIDAGPQLKRFHPISKGRAGKILKRTCHIYVEVGEK
jgi:large subunit ribosomal protein L22